MTVLMIMLPSVKWLAGVAALHGLWWAMCDLVLEHVGIPFLDAGLSRTRDR